MLEEDATMDRFSLPRPARKTFGLFEITAFQYRMLHWIANPVSTQAGLDMGARKLALGNLRKAGLISYDAEKKRYALTELGRKEFESVPNGFWQLPPGFFFNEASDAL